MGKIILLLFRMLGYDLIVDKHRGWLNIRVLKHTAHIDAYDTIQNLLKYANPQVVYDIGANEGHWSQTLVKHAPSVKEIVFFEPQSKYTSSLSNLPIGNVKKQVFQAGLGNENGTLTIMGGTHSASFLPVQEDYAFASELSQEAEEVEVRRLDDIRGERKLPQPDMIKVDVQGFELEVLKGSLLTLKKTSFLVLELSFDGFYKGQYKTSELFKFMEDNNFILVDTGFSWRKDYNINNRLLQMDGIFANKSLVNNI